MLYLGTSSSKSEIRELLDLRRIGLIVQPNTHVNPYAGWLWAADNGCYSMNWDEDRWRLWLAKKYPRSGCLFATVPDVVANHWMTLELFGRYVNVVREARYPVAFVGQDGATIETTPWSQFDCYFVGGSTEWKMGPAFAFAEEARRRGKWVHVGRINSKVRYQAWSSYADSCDGTFLNYGADLKNLPHLLNWLDQHESQPFLELSPRSDD